MLALYKEAYERTDRKQKMKNVDLREVLEAIKMGYDEAHEIDEQDDEEYEEEEICFLITSNGGFKEITRIEEAYYEAYKADNGRLGYYQVTKNVFMVFNYDEVKKFGDIDYLIGSAALRVTVPEGSYPGLAISHALECIASISFPVLENDKIRNAFNVTDGFYFGTGDDD